MTTGALAGAAFLPPLAPPTFLEVKPLLATVADEIELRFLAFVLELIVGWGTEEQRAVVQLGSGRLI